MSSKPNMIRKRHVEESDDSIDNTPKLADEETMAQRRIVRVKRPENSSAPSFQDAFKFPQNVGPGNAPSLATHFGTGGATGASGSSANNAAPSGGLFSFGSTTNPSASTGTKPGTPFSFGGESAAGTKPPAPIFSFGSKPSDDTAPKFTFGSSTVKDGTSAAPLFKFGDAVNSFIAAKKQIEEERASDEAQSAHLTGFADEAGDVNTETDGDNALANASSVVVASGDVLASIPSKLYIFKKDTQTWSECGEGEAKVKRHERPKEGHSSEPSFVYRLIVRDGYSLNALLNANFKLSKVEESYIVFAAPDGNGIPMYLLKYTVRPVAERGAEFSKVLKETLQLALNDGAKDKKD